MNKLPKKGILSIQVGASSQTRDILQAYGHCRTRILPARHGANTWRHTQRARYDWGYESESGHRSDSRV